MNDLNDEKIKQIEMLYNDFKHKVNLIADLRNKMLIEIIKRLEEKEIEKIKKEIKNN